MKENRFPRAKAALFYCLLPAACCLLPAFYFIPPAFAEGGRIERVDGLAVVTLSGTPYEMGRQHGELLKKEVRASVAEVLGYFKGYLRLPLLRTWLVNAWLDSAWRQAKPYVSEDIRQELRGIADGAGVPLRELHRLHALPDRTYSCSNFAAWGDATAGGRLIHMRNLDWNIKAGIQHHPVVFVMHPKGKRAFISLSWAGFAGVLSGINAEQLSVGQVGAATTDTTFRGEPMVFIMRRVLEQAGSLDEAAAILASAHRTVGINYVFASAREGRGIALETTRRHLRVFNANDPLEQKIAYARPIANAVFRADAAMDPVIRDSQFASHGNPSRPGLEDPAGSSAYDVRYLGQAKAILSNYGTITPETAQRIAGSIAPDSNVQSVIFAWPDLWVANAQGVTPAAHASYHHFSIPSLLQVNN